MKTARIYLKNEDYFDVAEYESMFVENGLINIIGESGETIATVSQDVFSFMGIVKAEKENPAPNWVEGDLIKLAALLSKDELTAVIKMRARS